MSLKVGLKDTVLKYELEQSVVLRFNSELINIEDKNGSIKYLFSLLDGRFSESEIIVEYNKTYPSDGKNVREYISSLKEMRVIEYIYENFFDEYKSIRWSRNFDFYDALSDFGTNKYNLQQSIFKSKICLLGCGGLGSHILYELSAVGFLNLTIVDFDKIELSNLNRQILYTENDIGKSKVFTAYNNIIKFSPHSKIKPIEKKLESESDICNLIKGHDLVICVADKPREKMVDWLNKACVKEGVPYINGGLNLARASFYSVIPHLTGCADCWRLGVKNSIQEDILNIDVSNKVDYVKPAPALSALVSVAAGVIVTEAIKLITKVTPPSLCNKLKAFDFSSCTINEVEKWKKEDLCPTCGTSHE